MNPKNLLDKFIINYAQKRLFGYGPTDNWSSVDNLSGPAKDVKLLGVYSGVAYRCINTIAEAVAGQYVAFPYTLDTKGKKQTVTGHPFWDVLNKPNPTLTYYQLIEGSASFVEQFGEFYWYVVPGSISGYANGIKEIYLLRPDKMGIVVDKHTGDVVGYNYNTGNGSKKIPFTVDEICHFMTFNPKDAYHGFSTVEAAIDYIQTEEEVSRFTRNYFKNNAAMSGIINVSGKVPRDSWNKFVRQWRERYEGVDNAGKVALIRDSQVTFTPVGSSVNDMQLTELKQTTVDQILMMFRIPKGLFGMESDQGLGRASVETLEYIFAKWTIDNKLDRFDDFIEGILQKYYANVGAYQVGHENIIPDDKEYKLSMYNQGVDRWITRQEIRDADPDLANNTIKGANQLFTLINQLPLTDPDETPPEPPKTPTPPPSKDDPDGDGDNPETDPDNDGKSMTVTLVKSKKKNDRYTNAQKEKYRLNQEHIVDSFVPQYKKAFVKVLDKQEKTVMSNVSHMFGKSNNDMFDLGEYDQEFYDALQPILDNLSLESGNNAMEFSGSDLAYSMSESHRNAIAKSTKKMTQNYNAETVNQLNQAINEGMQDGEGMDAISERVAGVFDSAKTWRTDRVARTELASASTGATIDAYQQNPVVVGMSWFADPDACEFCAEMDGTSVGTDQVFLNQGDSVDITNEDGSTSSFQADYGDVDGPPLHPNCMCRLVPELID